MKAASFHPDLMCGVLRVEYRFSTHTAYLHLPDGDCTDMDGARRMASAIDSEVRTIVTFSGPEVDTVYQRDDYGNWSGGLPE